MVSFFTTSMTKVVTVRPFRTTSQTPFEVPSETPFRPEPEGDVVKKYRLRDGVNFWIFNIFVFVRNGGKDDSVRLVASIEKDSRLQDIDLRVKEEYLETLTKFYQVQTFRLD